MIIACLLSFVINVDNVLFQVKDTVEGTVISKSDVKYLTDFHIGLINKYPLTSQPDDYKSVLIDKKDCVVVKK